MYSDIISFIRDMFKNANYYSSAEAYIVAHNPQDINDVARLEREYKELVKRQYTYFYHE